MKFKLDLNGTGHYDGMVGKIPSMWFWYNTRYLFGDHEMTCYGTSGFYD